MRRWIRAALVIALLVAILPVSARLIGQQQDSSMASLFTHPDGSACQRPCLFGVMPGETTAGNAELMLRSHPLTREFDLITRQPFRIEGRADRIMMVTFNLAADGLVDEVTLITYIRYSLPVGERHIVLPPVGTLGDVAGEFGDPDLIQVTEGNDPIAIYPDKRLMVSLLRATAVSQRRITPYTPIHKLTVFRFETCPSSGFYFVFPRWRGSAHFRQYIRQRIVSHVAVRRVLSAGVTFVPCAMKTT
jgi:hypothetical protein